MNQDNFNILKQNCLEALKHYHLKDALSCLKAICMELNDPTLSIEQESIESTYEMMLHFMSEGGVDPQRSLIHDGLLQRSYILLTKATRCYKQKNGTGIYAETLKKAIDMQNRFDLETLIKHIRIQSEASSQSENEPAASPNLTENLETLFNYLWTAPIYDKTEARKIAELIAELEDIQKRFLLSALLLNLLEGFDPQKFAIILYFLSSPTDEIRCHALTIFYFICQRHEKEICCNRDIINKISLVTKENKQLKSELIQLQKQLIICQKTEKTEQQLQEKIMPTFMNGNWTQIQKMGIDKNMDIHDLLTNLDSKQEKKLQDNMQKIMKMNEEGLDINTGVFKSMCNLPFFHKFTNWFWPFYTKHPDIYHSFNDQDDKTKNLSTLFDKIAQLSDLDKYGMACLINTLPTLNSNGLMNELSSMLEDQSYPQKTAKESIKGILKNETQCLYRFFYFYTFKSQFYNPFKHNCLFTDNQILRDIIYSISFAEEMADFLIEKEHYETVIEYTEDIIKSNEVTAKYLKNLGLSYQKTGHFNKALQYYQQADLLSPNEEWILNQQQHCYEQIGRTDLRLQCLEKLEEMEPDKVEITMEIILCLIQLKKFDEALKRSFKLEYMGQKELFARRIISWAYLQTNQPENALKYYQKIINDPKVKWEDYINAGHTAWILGQIPQAIDYYKTFIKLYLKSASDWENKFCEDLSLLYSYHISEKDIYLMMDIIRP